VAGERPGEREEVLEGDGEGNRPRCRGKVKGRERSGGGVDVLGWSGERASKSSSSSNSLRCRGTTGRVEDAKDDCWDGCARGAKSWSSSDEFAEWMVEGASEKGCESRLASGAWVGTEYIELPSE